MNVYPYGFIGRFLLPDSTVEEARRLWDPILDKLDVEAQANTELYEYVIKLDTAGALPHISAMPMTVFLDAKGTIAHIEFKAYTNEADVAAAARQYLGAGG